MKKASILFIAAFCFACLQVFAQKTEVGITGGITSSNIYGHVGGHDTRGDARAGFTVGMELSAPIGKSNFCFEPSLSYTQKGDYSTKTASLKVANALRYVELLADVVHYTKGKSARLFFGLGPSLALNLPSKVVTDNGSSKVETSITFGKEIADAFRGVDYGVNGIMGLRFKCGLNLSVNYTFGLRNIIPKPATDDDMLRNGCLGIRLGYFFRNPPMKK